MNGFFSYNILIFKHNNNILLFNYEKREFYTSKIQNLRQNFSQ